MGKLLSTESVTITVVVEARIPSSFSLWEGQGTVNNTPEQLEEYIKKRRKKLGIDIPFSIKSYLEGEILKPGKE